MSYLESVHWGSSTVIRAMCLLALLAAGAQASFAQQSSWL